MTTLNLSGLAILTSSVKNNVTLLGMLKFDDHVTDMCKKASKQLAVYKRLDSFN